MKMKCLNFCNIMLVIFFVCFVLFSTISSCEGKVQLPKNVVVKAVFAFGDSIVDQGNNNDIATIAKCNFPPYGKDFNGGIPTGRFGNGKTPPDILVEELGIAELVPAYLDPNLKTEDLKTGVSFASGGCGFDPLTSILAAAIPLSTQLTQFKEYIEKLKGLVGEEETLYILQNSIFVVAAGTDDIANTYFTAGIRLKQDINSYTNLMVDKASEFLQRSVQHNILEFGAPVYELSAYYAGTPTRGKFQHNILEIRAPVYEHPTYYTGPIYFAGIPVYIMLEFKYTYAGTPLYYAGVPELYNLGARKIGFFGIPPVGCLPSQRTLAGGFNRVCVEEYNQAAQLANTKLTAAINSLSKILPQSKIVFIDIYNPILDLIVNPQKYGFEEVEKGCCGTGTIEVTLLCNKFSGTCEDDTKYLFWDSYHPTEKAYRILVDQILKKYINRFL